MYNSTGQPRTNLGHLLAPADDDRSFFIMTPAEIMPLVSGLGPLALDVQRALASRLAVLSGPEQFNLNQTTGALSLQAAADFTTQPVHMLLLRVANRSVPVQAAYRVSDYALVQVVVEDTNTAPALMNLRAVHETVSTTSSLVRLADLPEDTPAGTVLATLEVRDDNPLTGVNFVPAQGATAYKIERTAASQRVAATASAAAHYLASYRLVTVAPDYEANATLDVVHRLVDNGRYGYDPLRQMVVRAAPSLVNTTMLRVNASVVDVNEAPVLRFMQSRVDLAENAVQDDAVVTVRAEDPEGLVANLTYILTTVPGTLAAAFNVTEVGATVTNEGRVATWDLKVADANALENAGDGQIFTLTLTATDLRGASTSAPLVITVLDVPSVLNVARVNTTQVMLSEQQALDDPDRVLRAPLFRFVDVQPDYDEYFFGLSPRETNNPVRFGDLTFAPGAISYVDAQGMPATTITDGLHNEERFNLFTLQEENAAVNLVLGEAGLIEPHLLGRNVRVEVRLSEPAGTGTPQTVQVPVVIAPTQPAGLRFADASAAPLMAPAAYNFKYEQTAYVDPLSNGACTPNNATQLTYDGRCYPTEQVRVDANSDPVLYVRRDRNPNMLEAPTTVTSVNNTFGIVLTETAGLTAEAIAIYTLDDEGNLAEATAAFATYFTYRVNTSYAANRTALLIEQKRHAVLYANGSVNPNVHYTALDTLPLDSREGNQRRVLSFFFVAGEGATNASRRAIAQVNVEVESAGLNVQARVTELRLGALNLLERPSINENGEDTSGFPMDVVNNPREVLTVTIENPDSAERNQTVNATIDVVVMNTDADDPAMDGSLEVSAGTASGNELVRLGSNADAQQRLAINLGARSATRNLPFQLARNVHGRAYIRVRFEERDDQEGLVEDPYYVYVPIEVSDFTISTAPGISAVMVDGQATSVNEDSFTSRFPNLRLTLANDHFDEPRQLEIGAVVRAQNAQNSPHAGLTINGSASVNDGMTDTTKQLVQQLTYQNHSHGTTEFTITTTASEQRGFAPSRTHVYAPDPLTPAHTFMVTPVNDLLTVDDTRPTSAASYALRGPDAATGGFNRGMNADGMTRVSSQMVAYFTDIDITTGRPYVPNAIAIDWANHASQPIGNSGVSIDLTNTTILAEIEPERDVTIGDLGDGDFAVRINTHLQLNRTQYDAIDSGGLPVTFNFKVNLTDNDASNHYALADARISITPQTDNANIDAGDYAAGTVVMPENTPMGTFLALASPINITDPDAARASGDEYVYTLDVSPRTDLLAWEGVVEDRGVLIRRVDLNNNQGRDHFVSRIQFARSPTDADVGTYTVTWMVSETRDVNNARRMLGNGTVTLHIGNVNDAIAVAATPAPTASGYHLQQDFGVRTLMERGMQLRADKVVRASFTDDDLLLANAAGQLPPVDDISISGTTVLAGTTVQVAIDARNASGVDVRAAGGNRLHVTVPVNLTLTPDQYDAINRADTTSIAFTLTVRDGNATVGPRPAANATGSFAVTAGANDVTLDAQIAEGALIQIPTSAVQYTQVGANFVLNDPEIRRNSGERITTAISSDHANLATNILEWVDLFGVRREITTVRGRTQDTLTLLLRTSRALTDADHAGFYNVNWSINDGETQLGSYFRLNVTDVNDPLVAASAPVANATYDLMTAFTTGGSFRPGLVTRDLTVAFTDADLGTASSTATRGGAASIANVLDLTPAIAIYARGATNPLDLATDTRFGFGPARVTNPSGDLIHVTVPIRVNLNQSQYDALASQGGEVFEVNITLANRDVYGGADGTGLANGYIVFVDPGADANVTAPAHTYEGGRVTIYREQAIVGSRTPGEEAVFLANRRQPMNISVMDLDIGRAGDTYTYAVNVTDAQNRPVSDLLVWHDAMQEVRGGQAERTTNYIRFARLGDGTSRPRGPQPGTYTVAWSISEAKDPGNDGVTNGRFTLVIDETPLPDIEATTSSQFLPEGLITGSVGLTMTLIDPGVPGAVFLNVSSATLNNPLVWNNQEDTVRLELGSRLANVTNTAANQAILNSIRLRSDAQTFEDEDVGTHVVDVFAYTRTFNGSRQVVRLVASFPNRDLALIVGNDLEATTVVTPASLGASSVSDEGLLMLADFVLEDEDFGVPSADRSIRALTSNLILAFNATGVADTTCTFARAARAVTATDADAATGRATYANLTLNLADCMASGLPNNIGNLYALSQGRTVHLKEIRSDDYADLSDGGDTTSPLVLATGVQTFTRPGVFVPGMIGTADDLIAQLVDNARGDYNLTASIVLSSWMPINNFSGTLDGNHHNITFDGGVANSLFNSTTSTANITNLGIIGGTLVACQNAGLISHSYATGDTALCRVNPDLQQTGGLVGENTGTIAHSNATGNHVCAGEDCIVGGLVGWNSGTIRHSYAAGNANASCTGDICRVGGLVGQNAGMILASHATGNSTISFCANAGIGSCNSLGASGGLVGQNTRTGMINASYATGNSHAPRSDNGGLVGRNLGLIQYSYALGNSGHDIAFNVGGLVGYGDEGTIQYSYATGNSTASSSSTAGGLVGFLNHGTINNAYATGHSRGSPSGGLVGAAFSNIAFAYAIGNALGGTNGGLAGAVNTGVSITASYRVQSTGTDGGEGDSNRTLAQLRCPTMANETCAMINTYEGWNGTIWNFGTSSDLPTLHNMPACPSFRPNCRH